MTQVTKESLAQWIAELEAQPHLSLKEERWLDVCRELELARKIQSGPVELPCEVCLPNTTFKAGTRMINLVKALERRSL